MHEGGGLKEDQELGCEMGTDIYTLLRINLVKAMDFPVVIYGYESWTIRKAEH